MADRMVRVLVTADTAATIRKIKEVGAVSDETAAQSSAVMAESAAGTGGVFERLGQKVSLWGIPFLGAAAAVGAATVGVGVGALHLADDFDKSSNKIAANAGISQRAAKTIADSFLDASNSTIYSATSIADSYSTVAAQLGQIQGKALGAGQAVKVMAAAQSLATASGLDLGTATDSLAGVMQVYQLRAGDAGRTSNVLYNAAKLTGNGVDTLSQQIAKMASGLGIAKPPLTQVGGLMVDLAAHGETGRKALSAVSSAMSTLISNATMTQQQIASLTDTAAVNEQQFLSLGLHVTNAQGKFVGMQSVIGQLQGKLAGLSQAQQLQTLSVVFGASAAQKMLATVDAGPAAYDRYTAKVTQANSVHAAAAKTLSNLGDTFKVAEVRVEDLGIKIGEDLMPAATKVAKVFAGLITFFTSNSTALTGLGIGVGVLAAGLFGLVGVMAATKVATMAMTAAQDVAKAGTAVWTGITWAATAAQGAFDAVMDANPIALVALAIVALIAIGVLLITHWTQVTAAAKTVWTVVSGYFTSLAGDIGQVVSNIVGFFTGLPSKITGAFGTLANAITSPFKAAFDLVANLWNNTLGKLSFSIPGWVPVIGGDKFSLPKIPMLATGGMVTGDGLAYLHAGEVVQNKQQQASASGGGDLIANFHGITSPQDIVNALRTFQQERGSLPLRTTG
ncbi:MAG: phage tail tape measure protein [Candidatus Dormiibacterota bacterium]